MADIQLRFNRDLLVLSSPMRAQLERLGMDADQTGEMTLLIEPEVYEELYALECAAGAQCLVADTAGLTPARLAHARMDGAGERLAKTALEIVQAQNPQHILAELGPCGLPLDPSSKASLNETRDQYVRAAGFFADEEDGFDAYFLNSFESTAELKCALMGMRKVTDKPIFASVSMTDGPGGMSLAGRPSETLHDAVSVMAEYGAQVVGFSVAADLAVACALVREAQSAVAMLPILVQLDVRAVDPAQEQPTAENPYFEPDTMVDAADALKEAGVQFLRAVGNATPSYTGALVAATLGDSVNRPDIVAETAVVSSADPAALADMLRAKVNDAIGNN